MSCRREARGPARTEHAEGPRVSVRGRAEEVLPVRVDGLTWNAATISCQSIVPKLGSSSSDFVINRKQQHCPDDRHDESGSVVRTNPPGSFPGMISLATAPITSPISTIQSQCIQVLQPVWPVMVTIVVRVPVTPVPIFFLLIPVQSLIVSVGVSVGLNHPLLVVNTLVMFPVILDFELVAALPLLTGSLSRAPAFLIGDRTSALVRCATRCGGWCDWGSPYRSR
jgi:hypothetical protein